jgi:hypothetical protein
MRCRLSTLLLFVILVALSLLVSDVAIGPVRGVDRELGSYPATGSVVVGVFAIVIIMGAAIAVCRCPSAFPIWIGGLLLFFLGFFALLQPAVSRAHERPRRARCARNLAEIAEALAKYRSDHGHYPPQSLHDAAGKPMQSWRVLILPYLGHKDLYEQYDFKRPWNGSKNLKLAGSLPEVFCCPTARGCDATETNYVAITGPGTAWSENIAADSNKRCRPGQLLLLIEVAESGICWLEPRDLNESDMIGKSGDLQAIGIDSAHHDKVQVACADGHVWELPKNLSATSIAKSLTVRTARDVDWRTLGATPPDVTNPIWGLALTHAAFPIWFLLVIVLLYRAQRSGRARIRERAAEG